MLKTVFKTLVVLFIFVSCVPEYKGIKRDKMYKRNVGIPNMILLKPTNSAENAILRIIIAYRVDMPPLSFEYYSIDHKVSIIGRIKAKGNMLYLLPKTLIYCDTLNNIVGYKNIDSSTFDIPHKLMFLNRNIRANSSRRVVLTSPSGKKLYKSIIYYRKNYDLL
jgi:hypothetical protein